MTVRWEDWCHSPKHEAFIQRWQNLQTSTCKTMYFTIIFYIFLYLSRSTLVANKMLTAVHLLASSVVNNKGFQCVWWLWTKVFRCVSVEGRCLQCLEHLCTTLFSWFMTFKWTTASESLPVCYFCFLQFLHFTDVASLMLRYPLDWVTKMSSDCLPGFVKHRPHVGMLVRFLWIDRCVLKPFKPLRRNML